MSQLGDRIRKIGQDHLGLTLDEADAERLIGYADEVDAAWSAMLGAQQSVHDLQLERPDVAALQRERDELQVRVADRTEQIAALRKHHDQDREALEAQLTTAMTRVTDLEVQAQGATLRLHDLEAVVSGPSDLGDQLRALADEPDGVMLDEPSIALVTRLAETADQLAHDTLAAQDELARERDTWTTATQVAENSARAAVAEAAAARAAQEQAEDVLEEAQRRLGLLEADEETASTTSASDAMRDLEQEMRRLPGRTQTAWFDVADRVRYLARLVDDQWGEQTHVTQSLQRQAVDQAALLEARGARIAELLTETTTLGERVEELERDLDVNAGMRKGADAAEREAKAVVGVLRAELVDAREQIELAHVVRGEAEERARTALRGEYDAKHALDRAQSKLDDLLEETDLDESTALRRHRERALTTATTALQQLGGGAAGLLELATWLVDTGEKWPEDGGPVAAVPFELDEVADWLVGRDLFVWREDGISLRLMPTGLSIEDGQLVLKGLGEQYANGTTTGIVFAGASGLERTHLVIDRSQLIDDTITTTGEQGA